MCGCDVLHDGDKLPALAASPLELLQFASQGNRSVILYGIEQFTDEAYHLLHAGRILFEQLPHDRFGFGVASDCEQCVGVSVTQLRRRLAYI